MCEKCIETDQKFLHYQRLAGAIIDQATIDAIKARVADLRAAKAARHRDPDPDDNTPLP
jgi:hypothetical protein